MASEDRFTEEWLDSAGLRWTESATTDERKGFALACSMVGNVALLDPETINVTTLKLLNGDFSEETKRGYLHALGVLSEAWAVGGPV